MQELSIVRHGIDEGMRSLVARLEGEVELLMAARGEDLRGMSTRIGDLELAIADKTFELASADGPCARPPLPVASQATDQGLVVGDATTDILATSRIARLEAEVAALNQRQGSLDARLDRAAALSDVTPTKPGAEVSAATRRQETDLVADVQVSFREDLEALSIRVDGMSDIKHRLAERLASIQASTANLERSMRKWASRMDEFAFVLADHVPRIDAGERKQSNGVAEVVVDPLLDPKPSWACEQAVKLSEEVYATGWALRLDQFTSVSASVEQLNTDDSICPEGFCVVISASCGQPVLLWRTDCRSNALARFGVEIHDSRVCDSPVPDVQPSDSASWSCQAGILKAMTCTTS